MADSSHPLSWRSKVLLLLILAAAAGLRLYKLGGPSAWYDERGSVLSATGHLADSATIPLNQVIDPPDLCGVRNQASFLACWHSPDLHPPLYPVLLRFWREAFGERDAAARWLSVLASMAALVFVFDVGWLLFGVGPALWACAIMAFAQPQIQYAQEIRDYALWLAFGMAATCAATRLIRLGPSWLRAVALAICVDGLLLTHYLAIGSIAALAVWCAVWLRGRALRQAAAAVSIALLILIPLGASALHQSVRASHDPGWLGESPDHHLSATLMRLALRPACFLAVPPPQTALPAAGGAVIFLLPFLLARRNPGMLWCGLWLAGGVGVVLVADLLYTSRGLLFPRYTLAATPACYLAIAALPLRGFKRHLAPAAALAACLLALPLDYDPFSKGQWRELGQQVRRLAGPGDVVVFASSPTYFLNNPRELYSGVEYYSGVLPCAVVLIDHPLDDGLSRRLKEAARVWVVTPTELLPGDFLPGWTLKPVGMRCRFVGNEWLAAREVGAAAASTSR